MPSVPTEAMGDRACMVEMQGSSPQAAAEAIIANMKCADLREVDRQALIKFIEDLWPGHE